MPELTVVILTKNEEQNIVACLESVAWADRRVIVDCHSEDATVSLAAKMGAQVLAHPFRNFADQRNYALAAVPSDWIFFVDADERATPELAAEVRRVIEDPTVNGWWVPRRNYIWGRWIRHAGWSPDYQLRLLRHGCARYDPERQVHEVVLLDGRAGHLQNPLIHYNYQTIGQFVHKQRQYSELEAEILWQQGEQRRWRKLISQPWREFWRRYVTLRGYKDGSYGLLLSVLLGYYRFRAYVRLWQRYRQRAA